MSLGTMMASANIDSTMLRNLIIANNATNPTYQVDITANTIQIEDIVAVSFSKTADIAVSGLNGLDTGAEAASTWYYVWAIAKVDGTVGSLISASLTAPTMPTGYTKKRRLCAIRNNASFNLVVVRKLGAWVTIIDAIGVARPLSTGQATTFTAVDCSTYIPPTSTRVQFHMNIGPLDTVVGKLFSAYLKQNGATVTYASDFVTIRIATASVEAPAQIQGIVDTDATQNIAYRITAVPNVGGGVYIDLLGYYEDV